MRLKRIEISGFKSFRDKTVFEFPAGISAIVGPNGSGKSNVVDAIRWAMGEQRVKSLRGKKMEDVIFGGSEIVAGAGMSEVTLLLDNHNGVFLPPYAELEEVSITRRLFRDTESEYYINKAPCRLLDIREFFLGTGLGGRTYSIIEQNSINGIIEARPEEIRAFIEEAAGISKYRSRKEAALRKLEAAEANIARVRDILRELKNQLNSLSRQAKRAQLFKEAREELKSAQLSLALQKCHELAAAQKTLAAKSEKAGDGIAALLTSQEALEAQMAALQLMLLEEGEALASAQQKLYETKNAINIQEQKIAFNEQKVGELLAQKDAYAAEVSSLENKIGSAEAGLGGNEREIAQLDTQLLEVQTGLYELQTRVAHLQSQEAALYQAIEQLKTEYVEIVTAKTNHRNMAAGLQKTLDDLDRKQKRHSGDSAEVQLRLERLTRAGADAAARAETLSQQAQSAQEKLQGITAEKTRLREEISALETDLESLRAQLSQKTSRYESLQEFQSGYSWCPTGAQALLGGGADGVPAPLREAVIGTISEHIEVEEGFENAIEAILGERMRSVLVASWEGGLNAIEYIRRSALERSSVIPLDIAGGKDSQEIAGTKAALAVVKPAAACADLARWLLRDSYIVDSLADGVRLWRQHGGGNFVTLEGDLVGEQGAIVGGAQGREEASLLKNKRELATLERGKETTAAAVAAADTNKKRAVAWLRQLEEEEIDTRKHAHNLALEAGAAAKDAEHRANEIAQLQQRMEVLVFETQSFAEEAAAAQVRLQAAQTGELQSSQREALLQEALTHKQGEWTASKDAVAAAQEDLTSQKVSLARLQADLRAKQEAAIVLKNLLVDAQATIAVRRAAMTSNEEQAQTIAQTTLAARCEIDLLLERCVQNEADMSRNKQATSEKEQTLARWAGEMRELSKKKEAAQKEQNEAQVELNNAVYQQGEILRSLAEKGYENTAASIAAFEPLSAQAIAAIGEVAEKRRRTVENFGEVNLLALSEYEQTKERHDFLVAQEADIINAIETLQRTVKRINNISRQRFANTFEEISVHFQNIFPRLFPGGKGRLALTNAEDLLETGVDVEIQTPNKKMRSITLLSGGEKSLAAIALIFALVFHKPSSFLILDEVDAALDDANIVLFNNILKDVSSLSQIILITHNRNSMEFADSLYGISIQADGVSTSLSVKLEQR